MEIIDSEFCKINGKEMTYFRYPLSLFNDIERTLSEIGAEKFFSNPHKNIKKIRESMAEFFFSLGLKKLTRKDWLIMQPEKEFPDFVLMSVDEGPNKIMLEQFELVEIMERCKSFQEMMTIINGKINKGYPENYNLLIFINHTMSREWLPLLHKSLEKYHPFKAVWTVHLLFQGKDNPYNAIVNRLRPLPLLHTEANFSDKSLFIPTKIPSFIEIKEIKDKKVMSFKKDFTKDLIKEIKRAGLKT